MICPFAGMCSGFEAFARGEEKAHLAWAFCLGEYADCDRYKSLFAGCGAEGRSRRSAVPARRRTEAGRPRINPRDRLRRAR